MNTEASRRKLLEYINNSKSASVAGMKWERVKVAKSWGQGDHVGPHTIEDNSDLISTRITLAAVLRENMGEKEPIAVIQAKDDNVFEQGGNSGVGE